MASPPLPLNQAVTLLRRMETDPVGAAGFGQAEANLGRVPGVLGGALTPGQDYSVNGPQGGGGGGGGSGSRVDWADV